MQGSVSSSGPLHAKLDFFEYLEVVAGALEYFGGKACRARVEEATGQLHAALTSKTSATRRAVLKQFRVCNHTAGAFDTLDFGTMVSTLASNIMGVVQYNNEGSNPNRTNITGLCARLLHNNMSTNLTALDSYAALNAHFLTESNSTCKGVAWGVEKSGGAGGVLGLDISYQSSVKDLQNINATEMPASRQWVWQTCREFGWCVRNAHMTPLNL